MWKRINNFILKSFVLEVNHKKCITTKKNTHNNNNLKLILMTKNYLQKATSNVSPSVRIIDIVSRIDESSCF